MAAGVVRLSDLIVPSVFAHYIQLQTQQKSRLINSGVVQRSAILDQELAGGGLTFNRPFFKDLDDDVENISSDDPVVKSSPNKIATGQEIQVRMKRNNSWSAMDLDQDLIGADPLAAIANRISSYWVRREQAMFIAAQKGVFADNAAAPTGTDTHTLNDMTRDVSGTSYAAGGTSFTTGAFIDACATMGDSLQELGMIMVHSVVYTRMVKNNLISFIRDSTNTMDIPTFMGREVVVDDSMPIVSAGVFETWIYGTGVWQLGYGSSKVPVEVFRDPSAGNGSGQETLYNRREFCLHPVGHAYVGTAAAGGPSNSATTNNLAVATSWSRVFPERKMIKMARLITREF